MIKVAVVKHHSFSESTDDIVRKVSEAASQTQSQIVLGPEYSLFFSRNRVNNAEERELLFEHFEEISRENRCIIVPGTMPHTVQQSIQMACPVFVKGCFIGYVAKKSSIGDTAILRRMGEETFKRRI